MFSSHCVHCIRDEMHLNKQRCQLDFVFHSGDKFIGTLFALSGWLLAFDQIESYRLYLFDMK